MGRSISYICVRMKIFYTLAAACHTGKANSRKRSKTTNLTGDARCSKHRTRPNRSRLPKEATMAVNKSKRSIHLTQPEPRQPQPQRPNLNANQQGTEQMPVRAHVYRTIADMNGGFEHVIEVLQTLQKIKHLPADSIKGIENQIAR